MFIKQHTNVKVMKLMVSLMAKTEQMVSMGIMGTLGWVQVHLDL